MIRRRDRTAAAPGFTLIETMVALVILSITLFAFYGFLSSALNGAGRVEAAARAYDLRFNALELANAVNPMDAPQGSFSLGSYQINWNSQPIEAARSSAGYPAGIGPFKVGLYRLTLSFNDPAVPPVEVTKLGYHRNAIIEPATGAASNGGFPR